MRREKYRPGMLACSTLKYIPPMTEEPTLLHPMAEEPTRLHPMAEVPTLLHPMTEEPTLLHQHLDRHLHRSVDAFSRSLRSLPSNGLKDACRSRHKGWGLKDFGRQNVLPLHSHKVWFETPHFSCLDRGTKDLLNFSRVAQLPLLHATTCMNMYAGRV